MKNKLSVMTVTPAMAKGWLDNHNTGNRPIRDQRVRLYAAQMKAGEWRLTGEPITFSDGRMINGQHRCAACVLANASFTTVVFTDAEEGAADVMDTGAGRSPGDLLDRHGIKSAHATAAAAKLVLSYEAGALPDTNRMAIACTRKRLADEVTAYAEEYSRAVNYGMRTKKNTKLNQSALAAVSLLLERNEQPAEEWLQGLATGAGLVEGDPRLALRNWAANAKQGSTVHHFAAIIRAWNASAMNEHRKNIKGWMYGTPFPRFIMV
jgi:hypothetical protein